MSFAPLESSPAVSLPVQAEYLPMHYHDGLTIQLHEGRGERT